MEETKLKKVFLLSDKIRRRIIHECDVTRQTVNGWANGKPVRKSEQKVINEIIKKELGYTIFKEEINENNKIYKELE